MYTRLAQTYRVALCRGRSKFEVKCIYKLRSHFVIQDPLRQYVPRFARAIYAVTP